MMKLTLLAFALVPTLAMAAPDRAGNSRLERIEREHTACHADEENHSTAGMNMCNSEAHQKADRLLNEIYQSNVSRLKRANDANSLETIKRLQAAQRAWITSRDADCQLSGTTMLGGSGESTIITGCLYFKTAERVKYLEEVLN